jgi:hypothetical protein
MPTFMDVVKRNNSDPAVGLIDETILLHPELQLGETRTIPGIAYDTLVRTALGNTAGSFRGANGGTPAPKHVYENRRVQAYLLEARMQMDKGMADGATDGPEAMIATELSGTLEGEFQAICKQFYYGPNSGLGNAKGFPGLIDSYDSVGHVVDAGGTTANTGTSIWLIRFEPQMVQWVLGKGGVLEFSPVRIESLIDPSDATLQTKFDGYVQTMIARPGLQVGSKRACVRIKNITADASHTASDALIYKALTLFEDGKMPNIILMTRRSLEQLRLSRTAVKPTGAPAPLPTGIAAGQDSNSQIPIRVTEAILNTEPLTL